MKDLVSIITPTFNSETFISETIASVRNQTYQNWEMIIVDDGSTDRTVEIIEAISERDKRIKLIRCQENKGAGVARNQGLEMARGRYISFLDADDSWKDTKLKKQVQFLQKNKLAFTFSFYELIDEEGNSLNTIITAPDPLTFNQLKFCNYVGNLTGIYDTEFFGKIPVSKIKKRQDWILWLKILEEIKTAHPVTESLAYYRIRKKSLSSSKINLLKYNYLVYRSLRNNRWMSSLNMLKFLGIHFFVKPKFVKKRIKSRK